MTLRPPKKGIWDQKRELTQPTDFMQLARDLDGHLTKNRRSAINDENARDVQALCVAEEAGELIGAYRRYAGKARRAGTFSEVCDELADLMIVTAVFAVRLGIDIDSAVAGKLKIVYGRGWQE